MLGAIVLSLLSAAPISALPANAMVVGGPAPHQAPRPTVVETQNLPNTPTPETYTVQAGEYLSTIGARLDRTWQQLASYNGLSDANLIIPGQVLRVPPADYRGAYRGKTRNTSAPLTTGAQTARSYTPPPPSVATGGNGVWDCIARLESGGNPAENTGNGFYGAFQFTVQSWEGAGGGPGLPSNYPYAEQLSIAQRLQQIQGWRAWPNTSVRCGV